MSVMWISSTNTSDFFICHTLTRERRIQKSLFQKVPLCKGTRMLRDCNVSTVSWKVRSRKGREGGTLQGLKNRGCFSERDEYSPLASWLLQGVETQREKYRQSPPGNSTQSGKAGGFRKDFHQDVNSGCLHVAGVYGVFLSFLYFSWLFELFFIINLSNFITRKEIKYSYDPGFLLPETSVKLKRE